MIGLFVFAGTVLGQNAVEERLRSALAGLDGVHFSQDEQTIVVRYRTQIIKVPRPKKAVRALSELVPDERPTLTGFKLETYDFNHGHHEPARPFQAVRMNAHWLRDYGTFKMDAVDREVNGEEKGRYYYLLWGNKADPKLIAKVRAALEKGTHPMGGG